MRVEATGVSFAEQQMRRGKYYDQPKFPFVPGYDLVGVREDTGARVAALTKVGAWADRVVLDDADLVPVPDGLDPEAVETLIVNGVTAWRMLHRAAKVRRGQTIVVLGAAGGVGTVLVQLARHAGIRVIGTAGPKQQDRLRALGASRSTTAARTSSRACASWRRRASRRSSTTSAGRASPTRGGCSRAAGRSSPTAPRRPRTSRATRSSRCSSCSGGWRFGTCCQTGARRRSSTSGRATASAATAFRAELREDLGRVLALLAEGAITPQIAARFRLEQAAEALRFAEAGGNTGKVLLLP